MARYIGNLALKDEDNLYTDANGNILKKTTYSYTNPATALSVSNRDGYEYVYSYSSVWIDQLTAISSYDCYGTQSLTPTVSYVSNYDGSGNPTSYLGSTLSWQGKRLTGVNSSTIYTYDENGLRTSKTVSGTTTEYYYNGSVLIGMKKGTGSTAIAQRFSYDSAGKVVAVDFSTNNGASFTTYYYVRNGQGDIIALINDSGTKVVNYTYDTWGSQISCTGSLSSTLGLNQPFRYRGYVYDTETQWYYLQSRYYNPTVGRFISADVLMSTGQGVLGYNMYAYCLNNPACMSDSSGCRPYWETDGGQSGYATADEAAAAWGALYRPLSKEYEYYGLIYIYKDEAGNTRYNFTSGIRGEKNNVIWPLLSTYKGMKMAATKNGCGIVAMVHTHPKPSQGRHNDLPSPADIAVADILNIEVYVFPYEQCPSMQGKIIKVSDTSSYYHGKINKKWYDDNSSDYNWAVVGLIFYRALLLV